MEWFKSYNDGSKVVNKGGSKAKVELDAKLLNQEIDDRNKIYYERLKLLKDK